MICTKCSLNLLEIQPKDLLLNEETCCESCKNIYKLIEKNSFKGYEQYQFDLLQWLYLNTPIKNGSNIIMANSKQFNFPRYDERDIIADVIKALSLENRQYFEKKEKEQVLNYLLGNLYDKFFNEIKNPLKYLFSYMSCLEYNRFIAATIVSWLQKNIEKDNPTNDTLVNMIIETLNFIKEFNILKKQNIKDNIDINILYFDLENLLAADRISLELGIELIAYKISKQSYSFLDDEEELKFGESLQIIRAIFTIHSVKIDFLEGKDKNAKLIFDINGYIKSSIKQKEIASSYIKDMTSFRSIQTKDEDDILKLNEVIFDHYGFELSSILAIVQNAQKIFIIGDEYLVGDERAWCEMIKALGNIDINEAKSIFKFLIYNNDKNLIFTESSRKDERALRKCLINIDAIFVCPVNIFIFSLTGLYVDIRIGDIKDVSLMKALNKEKIYEKIQLAFEEEVYKYISMNLSNLKIKKNIKQKDIRNVYLPGELDILLLYSNKIFVIECKHFNIKIDAKSMANEYQRLTKINKNSIQNKLKEKVEAINDNLRDVLYFMGENYDNNTNYMTIGVITTKNFTLASMEENLPFPIVTYENLCEWIKNK